MARLRAAAAQVAAGGAREAAEADLLQAAAALADAEGLALVELREGGLAATRLTLDARHIDRREEIEAELRHAGGEALRRPEGGYATPSRAAPGTVAAAAGL
ncbi:MAG: hypothetical protein AAGI51_07565, partial [Pseudomonadota bacterium]